MVLSTARLIFKALRLLWPYLRSAIFKDRTIVEVMKENQYLTAMLGLILMLVFALVISTVRLSELKEELAEMKGDKVTEQPCLCTMPFQTHHLDNLLKEN